MPHFHFRGRLWIFLASMFLLMGSGCALISKKSFSPIREAYPTDLSPSEILNLLKERHRTHPTLWASGKIMLRGKPVRGKKFFRATILFQSPDHLRLRGSRMITSTLFEFVTNGERVAVVFNKEREWFEGTRADFEEHPEATMGLNPIVLPRALLIQQEFMRLLEEGRLFRWRKGEGCYVFVGRRDDGRKEAFLLRDRDLLIREAGIYNTDGRLALRLRYRRYARFNGEVFPGEIEVHFPEGEMTAIVRIAEYKRHPVFQPAVFALTPPPGYKHHPLSSLLESPPMDKR